MPDSTHSSNQQTSLSRYKPIYWRKRLWLTFILLTLSVAHPFWLPLISAFLVYNKTTSSPDIIIPISGRTSIQFAKSLLNTDPKVRCHIILPELNRIHRLGIIPLPIEQTRAELNELGIDSQTITFHESMDDPTSAEDQYKKLADQLKIIFHELKAAEKITIITPSYMTRRLHWHLKHKLAPELLTRTYISAVPPQDFTLGQWWKSRHGIRCVVGEYLLLANFLLSHNHDSRHVCTEADFKAAAISEQHAGQ